MRNSDYIELFLELPPPAPPKPAEKEKEKEADSKPTFEVDYNVKLFELDI